VLLFLATVVSVFHAGAMYRLPTEQGVPPGPLLGLLNPHFLRTGAAFAVPLLAILLTHEFGHYFAARYHRVPASLPHFIPLPALGLTGTFGAVIGMHDTIRKRNALLDIGASGPLAGLAVAVPVLVWGLAHSSVEELGPSGYQQEGQSLLYLLLKRWVLGPIPPGHDVMLHPTAFAGWVGLLVTMINLVPSGQLDGGHIAFALFGERYNAVARWLRAALPLLFLGNLVSFTVPILLGHSKLSLWAALSNSLFWLMWFGLLQLMAFLAGTPDHPPVDPGRLSTGRQLVAWSSLLVFVLLFMPTPFAQY